MTSESSGRTTSDTLEKNVTGFNQSKMLEREHVSWDANDHLVVSGKKWKTDSESTVGEEIITLISKTEHQVDDEMSSTHSRMDNSCSPFDDSVTNQFNDETASPQPDKQVCKVGRSCSKIFTCTRCSYETDRKNNLKRHIATMHDPAPTALDCCGTRFATKGDLRDHTRSAHGAGYTCWQCGHTFCRRALLHRHQSVHSGLKAFSCSKCGYQSSHKSNMQRHMQVHLQSRGLGGSGGVGGRSKERMRNSVKLSFTKILSNSAKSGCSVSSDGNNCKNLSSFPSSLDDFNKSTSRSFYPPVGERITPPSQNATNPTCVIFPCNVLSKDTTSTMDGLRYLESTTSNNFNDKRFSRALTTIKSIHLSQNRINNKLKTTVNSQRPLSNSCDTMSSQNNEVNTVNPHVWRLAFGGQSETHTNYQQDMEILRRYGQTNERNIPSTKANPVDFSRTPLFHETSSAPDIFPASYFVAQSRVSQQQANTSEGNTDPLMNNSRLESSPSQSKISNLQTFLPRTAFHSDFREPPMMDSLQSGFSSEPSYEYETAMPLTREGIGAQRFLHRPIPTYPRPVTDFSVNSLLAKAVSGCSSTESTAGPIAADQCLGDVTQSSATPEEAAPRPPSSSLLRTRPQTSAHLQPSDLRVSAFEQRLKHSSPLRPLSFDSRDCAGRVSEFVDFSRREYTLRVHRISAQNNLGNTCHRPGFSDFSAISCDQTPSPSCTHLSSPHFFQSHSSSRDQICFKGTNSSLFKTVGNNPPVPKTLSRLPYSDPNVPLDCTLPKSNNTERNHSNPTEFHCIDNNERSHHNNFSSEVLKMADKADSKSTQAVISRPIETTVRSKRVISIPERSSYVEGTWGNPMIVQGCSVHGSKGKLQASTGKQNVLATEEAPTTCVKSQPEQYIPKKIRALNRTWQQVTEGSNEFSL